MKYELLLPAGDLNRLKTAIFYGADAVYIGGQNYSLRANARNFSIEDIKEVNGNKYLLKVVEDMDINSLKQVMDNLVNENNNLFILIVNKTSSNINFLARSNTNINAGNVIRDVTNRCGGNGGGSNKFAQGAGKDISEIYAIFEEITNGNYNE